MRRNGARARLLSLTVSNSKSLLSDVILPDVPNVSIFVPTDISGLVIWNDASDTSTITETAGKVLQLDDKSGNDNHFSNSIASEQPTTNVTTVNGLNVIDFDTNILSNNTGGLITTDHTIIIVFSQSNTITSILRSSNAWGLRTRFNGDVQIKMNNSNFNTPQNLSSGDTQIYGYSAKLGQSSVSFLNGATASFNAPSSITGGDSNITLGATSAVSENLEGHIGEVLVYNKALTTAELNQLGQYLDDKWGITWTEIT